MSTSINIPISESQFRDERFTLEADIVEAALDMRLKDETCPWSFEGDWESKMGEDGEAEYWKAVEKFNAAADALLEFEDKHDWRGFE